VKSGSLPSVSWIVPPLAECEHPAAPPEWGEYLVQQILSILVSNPDVWARPCSS
jgi:phospholipase C